MGYMTVSTPPARNGKGQPNGKSQLVFTSSQAAVYLGVSLATIRRWTDAGHVNCYRTPGGQRRFSREQLDGFVASMHQGSPETPSIGHEQATDIAASRVS